MRNKHIRAFTILETLIGLMLLSIIITVSYSLFNLIGKQLHMFQEGNTQILEYNLFNATILRDVNISNSFEFSEGHLLLKFYDKTELEYHITSRYILRNNRIKIDTFNLNVLSYQFLTFKENSQNSSLSIAFNVLNDTIQTNYFLKKDLSEIINQTYFNED